jgi:hypothetical protein
MLTVRGFQGIRKIFSGGGDSGAIVPSNKGELGRLYTGEAKYLARLAPKFGQLDQQQVVNMASQAEQAKVQLTLLQEANKHFGSLAQAATQVHSAQLQQAQILTRADESFQRTNVQAAQAGFKHSLRGNTQEVQMSAWQGRKSNAKAALYG